MSPKQVMTQIELNFWSQAIPLMSEAKPVQKVVRFGYDLYQRHQELSLPSKVILWGSMGWIIGLTVGLVSTL